MNKTTTGVLAISVIQDAVGFCGCSDTAGVLRFIRNVLRACDGADSWGSLRSLLGVVGDDWPASAYIVLAALDRNDWIEHGTDVRCSWRTKKGEEVLALLTDESIAAWEKEAFDEE